ncbi:hypothetical protein OnM2_078052, partial [Erysiphe neolycopersici]
IVRHNEIPHEQQIGRSLRTKTESESGKSTRREYTELAGFNPIMYIRQAKTGQNVYMALEPRMRGDYFVNSKYITNFVYNLMSNVIKYNFVFY